MFRDPDERARAVGIWGGAMGVGLALGPLAGGLLLASFWWGSVFFVNVPVLIAGGIAALRLLPESRNVDAPRPDPVGSLLSILGLGLLLWAIIEAPTKGWTSDAVVAVGAAGLAVIARVRLLGGAQQPSDAEALLLPLPAVLRRRRGGRPRPLRPVRGGLHPHPVPAVRPRLHPAPGGRPDPADGGAAGRTAPLSTLIVRRIGSKLTAFAGLVAIAGGLWQISAASTAGATYGDVLPGMLLLGFGSGLLMPTAADAVLGSVPRRDAGVGSATYVVAIQVGGALGVAVIGSMLNTRYRDRLTDVLASHHVPPDILHTITGSLGGALGVASAVGGSSGSRLAEAARSAFMSGTHVSLAAGAVVAAVAALLVLLVLPSRAPKG